MAEIEVAAAPEGEEFSTQCNCCGRPIYWGMGRLESGQKTLATYWYSWSEGHRGRFCLGIARFDDDDNLIPGVACFSGRVDPDNIVYSALDSHQAPWSDLEPFGQILDRKQILPDSEALFSLVDAIAANEKRLSTRILACGLNS